MEKSPLVDIRWVCSSLRHFGLIERFFRDVSLPIPGSRQVDGDQITVCNFVSLLFPKHPGRFPTISFRDMTGLLGATTRSGDINKGLAPTVDVKSIVFDNGCTL